MGGNAEDAAALGEAMVASKREEMDREIDHLLIVQSENLRRYWEVRHHACCGSNLACMSSYTQGHAVRLLSEESSVAGPIGACRVLRACGLVTASTSGRPAMLKICLNKQSNQLLHCGMHFASVCCKVEATLAGILFLLSLVDTSFWTSHAPVVCS